MKGAAAPPIAATPKGASSFSKRTPASTATWSPKWWWRRRARCFSSSPTRPIRSPTWRAGSPDTTVCSAPARCSTACACVFISPRGSGSIPFRSRPRSSASTAPRRCFSGRRPAWAACRSPRLCRQERRWRTCAAASSTTCATPTSRSSKATRRASSASALFPRASPKQCCATSGRCCRSVHTTPATASLCPCRASSAAKASAASSSRRCPTRNGAPSPKAPRCFAKLYRGCWGSRPSRLSVLDARAPRARQHAHALACFEALRAALHHGDGGSAVKAHDELLAILRSGVVLDRVAGNAAADRAEDGGYPAPVAVAYAVAEQAADRRARDGSHRSVILVEPHRTHALDGSVGHALDAAGLAIAITLRGEARAAPGTRQCRCSEHGGSETLLHVGFRFTAPAKYFWGESERTTGVSMSPGHDSADCAGQR